MQRHLGLLPLTFLMLLAACEDGMIDYPPGTDAGTPPGNDGSTAAATVTVRTTSAGTHLADGEGNTLYVFARDVASTASAPGSSSCAGACLTNWPAFSPASFVPGEGVNAAALGWITRADGTRQATYRGWPLYTFANDAAPGDANGEGNNGVWFVARAPFYSVMVRASEENGQFLVDGAGRTMYLFRNDTRGEGGTAPVSMCSGMCLNNWPIVPPSDVRLPSSIAAADVTTLTRADGTEQLVYRGWPLYYFAMDTAPGDAKGKGVNDVWDLVAPPAPAE
ncbi:hypothetical protein [Sandaracinus amylolyticus]|uniref:Lipoprotein n=1 Tax=Sandaracinus amylolyticus TaxID=927083 RepID=A0A0F6YFW9_9BACT|nr:hypothetical protein [Sandaracinus amylolyticus]AKF04126.1 Hypothetical protein DB32_001275 [Sandaracinus amylolyticus]